MNSKRAVLFTCASVLSAAVVFVFDVAIELGVATPTLYVATIWLAYWTRRPSFLTAMAIVTTSLSVVGLIASPAGGEDWKSLTNRVISVVMIWLTTLICRRVVCLMGSLEERMLEAEILAAKHEASRREQQRRSKSLLSVTEDLQSQQRELIGEVEVRRRAEAALAKSEQQMRTIIDATPNGMLMINGLGQIVMVNSQTEQMFGYSREELLGKPVEMLLPERFREDHPGHRRMFFSKPEVRAMGVGREVFGQRKDGTEFPVELGLNPIVTDNEVHVLSSIVDITQRVRDRQALVESEQRTRLILDSSLDAVVMIDSDGDVTGWNPQAQDIFDRTSKEVMGHDLTEMIIPPRYRESHRAGLAHFLETGESRVLNQRIELTALRRNGAEFPVELCVLPLQLGDRYEFCAFVRDITAQAEARRRLEAYAADLRRSNQELEQFAYVASHDLQEPLRKVASCCQALAEDYADKLDDEAREWIHFAVDGAIRMRRLVADLLGYSRVATKGKPLVAISADDACHMAIENLQQAIEDSAAEITIHPLPNVLADESQLVQLLQNLIGNALKYRGEQSPQVEIGAEADGDHWKFFVRDNGIGIAPEYFERIFAIFQRLHRKEEYSGTGIGLAICKKIVERHGGAICVESAPGEGTTFLFTLSKDGVTEDVHTQRQPAAAAY